MLQQVVVLSTTLECPDAEKKFKVDVASRRDHARTGEEDMPELESSRISYGSSMTLADLNDLDNLEFLAAKPFREGPQAV